MTNAANISDNLLAWEKDMKETHDPEFALSQAEEISLDEKKFESDKCSVADWNTLMSKCGQCIAFSATQCGLKSIEAPEKSLDIEVLDFSENEISDISFVTKFPNLVSLSLNECKLQKFEELSVLKDLQKLQILEIGAENFLGEADEEALHKRVFEMIPDLISFNGMDKEREPVMMGMGGEEEEGMFGLEEEDMDDLLGMEEEDYDDEEIEEGDEDEEDDEPAAKRQKTEE